MVVNAVSVVPIILTSDNETAPVESTRTLAR